ncbi:MAG: hypothetical protein ACJAT7_001897 [Psychromonas sp.]|jgi:hypothetical protein|uniref:hypothetical protein n=1 Tax=Psychromonas sp. TaxID=1884585 RepID=UPI0039E3B685
MKIAKTLLALSILLSFNAATAATSDIEVVAEITNTRPGNITITPNGRMILSLQPLDGPELRVVELMAQRKGKSALLP